MNFLANSKSILCGLIGNKQGNTMIVAPLIIAIVGGTAAVSTDNFDHILQEARDTRRAADAYQVTVALAMYYDDHNEYPLAPTGTPESWELLRAELEPSYVQELPDDPGVEHGFEYVYESEDGQLAKVIYYSEVQETDKERWSF